MKKSISIWSFYGPEDLEGKLKLAKAAGFEGFEIDLSGDGPVNMKSTEADLTKIRKMADKIGIQISGLATGMYWGTNPVSADAAVRKQASAILKKEIECAAGLGLDAILVVPGAVGADFVPNCEVVPYDLAYERATEFVKVAVPLAEKLKVTIGIENVWNKFLLSPLEMRTFIDSFGSANVGAYYDVGNSLAYGYPQHWISILGKRIKRVHFKDYRRAVGTVDGFVDLLSGDLDWPQVMQALRKVGYDGWCTAEMIPPVPFYKHAPQVLVHNTARAMQAIFDLK
ncbi:MAG: sugar phosphate isomerase/epimerase [Planctomycetes bacterium]|nr:sugar phosphate isomerase/epimerase [Planctomycetota bacterium]